MHPIDLQHLTPGKLFHPSQHGVNSYLVVENKSICNHECNRPTIQARKNTTRN